MNNKKRVLSYLLCILLIAVTLNCSFAMDNETSQLTVIDENTDMNIEVDNNSDYVLELKNDDVDKNTISDEGQDLILDDGYVPDSKGIYVSPNGHNLNNGSYYSPYKSIDTAIFNAKDGKTIYLAGGTYKITRTIAISYNLVFTAYDGTTPVIDAQNLCSILKLSKNCEFTFNGINFVNGYATNGGVVDFQDFNQYKATFYNCSFVNNTATNYGGVFYEGRKEQSFSMTDKLFVTSCSFYNNSANLGSVYYGGSNTFSCLNMQYCVALGNTNYAVYAIQNRDGTLTENYWGENNINSVVSYSGCTPTCSKLVLICDNSEPTVDDVIVFTAKLINSNGVDFASNVYIPQIPIAFTATSGVLSKNSTQINNNKAQTVLSSLEEGPVTVFVEFFGFAINKTLTVLPAPLYVSADAQDGAGDGSFNNPYSFGDAIDAVNNGAINKIKLFEGNYEFNEPFVINRDVTICSYSTPYKLDKVNIISNNGFLSVSENVNADIFNLTIWNSNSDNSPLFDIQDNSRLNIANLVIKNNTLSDGSAIIANVGNGAVLDIEYSLISGNSALIQNNEKGYLFNNNGEIFANNNWWGSNQGADYYDYLTLNNEINSTVWIIISKIQQEKEVLRTEWTSTFTIALSDNDNNPVTNYMPDIDLMVNTNTGILDTSEVVLNNVKSTAVVKISEVTSEVFVECIADNEDVVVHFEYEIPLTEIFISVDGDDENGDGSFDNPFLTIPKAISRAKEAYSTIYFLKGIYDVNFVCGISDNRNEYTINTDNSRGFVINNRNVSFSSYNGQVIFDRTNSYYVFNCGANSNVTLSGINFNSSQFTGGSKMGGIGSTGVLIIKNCSFSNVSNGGNFAEFIGISGNGRLYVYDSNFTNIGVSGKEYSNGAIRLSGSGTYAYIYNCYFSNNGKYKTGDGYGLTNSESAFRCQNGFIEVENSRFENSSKIAMIYDRGRMNFNKCTFENNGGISCLDIGSHGYGFNVDNCIFLNNKAGAIGVNTDYLVDNEVNIYNSRFINNTAGNGGAIYLAKAGAVISNCYFEGNTAVNGGAIYNSYASLLVEHCEFYNNSATNKGGSIYTEGNDDYIDIQYNIFTLSDAATGGAIYSNGITSLFYNIMSNCTAEEGAYIYNANRVGNVYLNILNNETVTAYKGDTLTISAFLSDDMGNSITGGNVSLKVNNKEFSFIACEGIVSVDYTFNDYGTYVVDGNYSGSRRYIVIVGTATINIDKKPTDIYVSDVNIYYPLNGNINAVLTDYKGNPISNANLLVRIGENNYQLVTDTNGEIIKDFALPIGRYNVFVQFNGDDDYASSNASAAITVLSTISADDMIRGYNSGIDFRAILVNTDGTPLSNEVITFNIGGKEYSATSDSEGVVILNEKLPVGNYNVMITNPVSNESVVKSISIVKRIDGNNDLDMFYMDGSKFKVRIIGDDGNFVGAGQIVTFKISNINYYVKTDENGYASLSITMLPKTYTITTEYNGYSTNNQLKIKQVVKASNVKVKKSAKMLKIKVSLKKVNGKYLKGKKLTLKFKGKKVNAKTNKKGVAVFKIKKNILKKLKAGKKYTFKVTYIKTTVSKKVIVKR